MKIFYINENYHLQDVDTQERNGALFVNFREPSFIVGCVANDEDSDPANVKHQLYEFLSSAEKLIFPLETHLRTSDLAAMEQIPHSHFRKRDTDFIIGTEQEPEPEEPQELPTDVVGTAWGLQFETPFNPAVGLRGNGHLSMSDAQKDLYFYYVEVLRNGTFNLPEDKQNFNFQVASTLPTNWLIHDQRRFELDYRNNTPDSFSGPIQITMVNGGGVKNFTVDFNR